jgi:hypothetical protein
MLVATSEDPPRDYGGEPGYYYVFQTVVAGPTTELDQTAPSARYRVLVTVNSLGPGRTSTAFGATAMLYGTFSRAGVSGAPNVSVSVSRDGIALDSEATAQSSFQIAPTLAFQGNCGNPPEAPPCTATFLVDFARDDAGDGGGSITGVWSLTFTSSVRKHEPPDEAGELPWTVEFTAE